MQIVDISRPLTNDLAPWPGDTAFRFALNWKMAEGASVNVGKVTMGVHNGTHADAPFHFERDGATIEKISPDVFLGPAVVVDLTTEFSSGDRSVIEINDLLSAGNSLRSAPRLLLKTSAWPDSKRFPTSIPVIAKSVPDWLKQNGVRLLGLDLPSVDPIDSKDLANHHALVAAGIQIVESLDLRDATAGIWNLSALPLPIAGGDAAPLRAVLWRD